MTSKPERSYAVALACAFTLAVITPTVLGSSDSFPLSTYPMFAKHRGQPTLVKLIALTPAGPVPVPPEQLGTGEVLQAKALLEQVAVRSRRKRNEFCSKTARRLAKLPQAADWQELRLVRVKYDPIDYFYNGGRPMSRKVLASCLVKPDKRDANAGVQQHAVKTAETTVLSQPPTNAEHDQ